jgi:hypothetical protein
MLTMYLIVTLKQQAIDYPPGIHKTENQGEFDNLIGKTIMNLSNIRITPENARENGITFCSTPSRPGVSEI